MCFPYGPPEGQFVALDTLFREKLKGQEIPPFEIFAVRCDSILKYLPEEGLARERACVCSVARQLTHVQPSA